MLPTKRISSERDVGPPPVSSGPTISEVRGLQPLGSSIRVTYWEILCSDANRCIQAASRRGGERGFGVIFTVRVRRIDRT